MDSKYLAEIKVRCADVCNHGCTTDMMAVFSRYVKALYADNIVKDQQIATLKKALELACAELNLSDVEKVFAPDYFIQQAQKLEAKK